MTDKECVRAGYDRTGRYHVPQVSGEVEKATAAPFDHVPSGPLNADREQSDAGTGSPAARDMCPDCRCAPNMPHSPDCGQNPARVPSDWWGRKQTLMLNITEGEAESGRETVDVDDIVAIPLDVQERLFQFAFLDALDALGDFLLDNGDDIREMALARLRSGHAAYGSEMFTWGPERRRDELMQEVCDAIVYWISGSVGP